MTASGPAASFARLSVDLKRLLTVWTAPDEPQEALRRDYLAHLRRHPDAVAKTGPPAHFTASCLVLDRDGAQVLLTHHRKARMWYQFGGHLEASDRSVHAAAEREAREESGIADLVAAPGIVQLDRHRLVGDFGRCREHLDVRFGAVVDSEVAHRASAESLAVGWWPVDGLPAGSEVDLRALVQAARRTLAQADPTA